MVKNILMISWAALLLFVFIKCNQAPPPKINASTTLKNGGITGDLVVGAFGGSTVDASGKVITDQIINVKHMRVEQSVGGLNIGNNVFHETIESYIAGKNNPGATPTPRLSYLRGMRFFYFKVPQGHFNEVQDKIFIFLWKL